jgi:hypothetical protein
MSRLPESRAAPTAETVPPAVGSEQNTPEAVLITEQEVVFSTAAALSVPPTTAQHRWLAAALIATIRRMWLTKPTRPRRHYHLSREPFYMEEARMSREMHRL